MNSLAGWRASTRGLAERKASFWSMRQNHSQTDEYGGKVTVSYCLTHQSEVSNNKT